MKKLWLSLLIFFLGVNSCFAAINGGSGVSGDGTVTVSDITDASANGRSLISAADYAAMKVLLDLEIGTDVQAYSAVLDIYAGVSPSVDSQNFLAAATTAAHKAILSVDDLITLSGVADGAVNLGSFTGTTITDNIPIKAALQLLEIAVEGATGTPAGSDGAMQYNNGTVFGGFGTYNDATYETTFPGAISTPATTSAQISFFDSDSPGTDKSTGYITLQYVDGADGAENSDWITYCMQAGSFTEILRFDESDDRFETSKGLMIGNNLNIQGAAHHTTVTILDPNTAVTASVIVPVWTLTDAAMTVTKITVSTSSASYEAAGDLKWADARIGLANATVINDFDTTSGVRVDDTITAGSVAAGKFVYLSFDSAPNALMTDFTITINWDYD